MTKFTVGQTVAATNVGHRDWKSTDLLKGTVVGYHPNNRRSRVLVLINFGATFDGHKGFGQVPAADGLQPTCWYVHEEYVTALPDAVAPKAAPQAKQQSDRILQHLLSGKTITQLEAFGVYRIFRLAARIHDLKAKGHRIVTTMRKDETGKQYAEYSLRSVRRVA
jgi:hypothetical protein